MENYLKIQKERYLDRFEYFVEWEVGVQHLPLPPLIIQTFVENCIKYGMRGEGKTFIYVLASLEGEHLKLMIADTGNGFSQEVMDKVRTFIDTRIHQEGLGVGIQNAFERLYILYGEGVEVKLRNALSGGAVVELYLPIEQSEDEEEQERKVRKREARLQSSEIRQERNTRFDQEERLERTGTLGGASFSSRRYGSDEPEEFPREKRGVRM